jgi:aminoglycoside/choline kinase family phosphotransferase
MAVEGIALYGEVTKLFESKFGCEAADVEPITSHGSDRMILRLRSSAGDSAIGIVNQNVKENIAFIAFAVHFRNHGLNVPEIYERSSDNINYLMEDLGDTTLLKKITALRSNNLAEEEKKLYRLAIEALPEFQLKAGKSIDFKYCYQFNEFSEENIRFDINYFNERFLKNFYKGHAEPEELEKEFDYLTGKLLEIDRSNFLYRDYQSRNIMIKNGKLYFIDFQSGRRGALLYDIASLIYDAKANIPQYEREYYIEFYLDEVSKYIQIDKSQYRDYFWYFAIIRILQAMGAYGYLGLAKGKSRFLESIPLAINNVRYILDNKINNKHFRVLTKIFSEITI